MTPAEREKIKNFYEWLVNRSGIYAESVKKYKDLGELELTCYYNGKAEALTEAAERLATKFGR